MNSKRKKLIFTLPSTSVIDSIFAANAPITLTPEPTIAPENKITQGKNSNLNSIYNMVNHDDLNNKADNNKIVLNFESADIQTVIKASSEHTGKNS